MKLIIENWNKFVNEAFPDVPAAYTPTNKTTKLGSPKDPDENKKKEELKNQLKAKMGIDLDKGVEHLVAKYKEVLEAQKKPENRTMDIYYALNDIKQEISTKAYLDHNVDIDDLLEDEGVSAEV
jgi:hypothetical protein